MIKNRKIQLIYLSAACTIGIIGALASTGFFEATFRWDFYIYFTNISNYLCVAIMFMELSQVFRSKDDGYINTYPTLKFMGLISILLTFFMFNIVMAPSKSLSYILSIRNLSLHVIIPILYSLDWFLFYKRGKTNLKYPLLALIFPVLYFLFILIHAVILKFDSTILCFAGNAPLIYPYFFLDYDNLGFIGLITWAIIIILALLIVGYMLYFLDHLKLKNSKRSELR